MTIIAINRKARNASITTRNVKTFLGLLIWIGLTDYLSKKPIDRNNKSSNEPQ